MTNLIISITTTSHRRQGIIIVLLRRYGVAELGLGLPRNREGIAASAQEQQEQRYDSWSITLRFALAPLLDSTPTSLLPLLKPWLKKAC